MNYNCYSIKITLMGTEGTFRIPLLRLYYAGNGQLSLLQHMRHKFTDINIAENTRSALRPLWSPEEADITLIPETNYPLEVP